MDWTTIITRPRWRVKSYKINGQKYCADNYYSDLTVEGGNCELCPSSSLSGDNLRKAKHPIMVNGLIVDVKI